MQLNITRLRGEDYGDYYCVAKNYINTTTAIFYVNGETIFNLCFYTSNNFF